MFLTIFYSCYNTRHRILISKLFILLICLLTDPSTASADTSDFKDLQDDEHTYIYEDKTGKLNFIEISSKNFQKEFKKTTPSNTGGNGRSVYWIKFIFNNNTNENLYVILSPSYAKIDFYLPLDSGKWEIKKNGFLFPYKNKDYKYSPAIFNLPSTGKLLTYYLRIESQMGMGISFEIRNDSIFKTDIVNERLHILLGGVMLMVFVYSLIFFIILRNIIYFYYCCYIIGIGLFAIISWGFINRIFNFTEVSINVLFYSIPFNLATIFLLLYSKSFLRLRQFYPFFNKLILACIAFKFFSIAASLLLNSYALLNPIIDNFFLLIPFVAGILSLKGGHSYVRYYITGFAFYFTGLVFHYISFRFPYNFKSANFSIINFSVVEMIFFSFALADRFRILRNEREVADKQTIHYQEETIQLKEQVIEQLKITETVKDKINKELEERITERTQQIKEQKEEIERMNALLLNDNQKLEVSNKSLKTERILQKAITIEEFSQMYPDEEACYKFLYELKWKDGFICKKCKNTKFSQGNVPYSCKCSRCRYIETCTIHTIFSQVKFPILKAFYLLIRTNSSGKVNIEEVSQLLQLRQQTCRNFVQKINERISQVRTKRNVKDGWMALILDN